jgi:AhpD family alkylhydroperoxidase
VTPTSAKKSEPSANGSTPAVTATNGCDYCVNSHTASLRKLGLSTAALGEVLAIASLFNMTNTLADGYQVEPDVLPPLD